MKLITAIFTLITFTLSAQRSEYIDENLKPYVYEVLKEFQSEGLYHGLGDSFVVMFSNVKSTRTGAASGKGHDNNVRIVIYKDNWEKLTHTAKKFVMLHELAHDYLNLEHEDSGIMIAELKEEILPSELRDLKVDFYNKVK